MSGRIRSGIYVLGLVRIRSCGQLAEMARSLFRLATDRRRPAWARHSSSRSFPGQSPSCFRSRR